MNNYEAVKAKIIESNPSILDLVFGCEVIFIFPTTYDVPGIGTLPEKEFCGYYLDENHMLTKENMQVSIPNGVWKNNLTILGRKINWEDVLVVLGDRFMLDCSEIFTKNIVVIDPNNKAVNWKLGKTLDQQDQPLINFLFKILCQK